MHKDFGNKLKPLTILEHVNKSTFRFWWSLRNIYVSSFIHGDMFGCPAFGNGALA